VHSIPATSTKSYLKYLVRSGFNMLPTNNSYYNSTSYPHRSSHRHPPVRNNLRGAGGETPPSETQRGGGHPVPGHRRHRRPPRPSSPPTLGTPYRSRPPMLPPPLLPTRAEPHQPRLVPPGLPASVAEWLD